MVDMKEQKFLTVAPFECAWQEEFKFKEAGRGCVAFEAFAINDVTVVFREHVGSQHYHYKTDSSPHYTVILGSHRNRRLKIEVNGKTVVDEEGVGLCSLGAFQSYWISIYDGLICVGKGRYPFQNVVFQWLDSNPIHNVQYVGLSSWDKHVGYRNVNVLPLTQNHISLWKQLDLRAYSDEEENEEGGEAVGDDEKWGLAHFLENWELSDVVFVVGMEERPVPAHKIILAAAGNFQFGSSGAVLLPEISYPTFHAFLRYIYTGQTMASVSLLIHLKELSLHFEVMPLAKQCEECIERFKLNKRLFDSGQNVEICYPNSQSFNSTMFPCGLPISRSRIKQFFSTGDYCDVEIRVEDSGFVVYSHKIIISLWSFPFMKMLTNGMSESISSKVYLREVSPEAFKMMIDYMYSGELLGMEDLKENQSSLLQLLLLADQFHVPHLLHECCKILLECLSEDSVCQVLQVISSVPSFKIIEEYCKRKLSMQFDYCTTASMDFSLFDKATFRSILQHPDLTVTSEEWVLNAVLLWSLQARECHGWEFIDESLKHSAPEVVFGDRLDSVNHLLPLVRFPLMPSDLLKKLEKSNLFALLPAFRNLVKEAINYAEFGVTWAEMEPNPRFHHRKSSYKELQYISDGDSNGALYYAGTTYGEHTWVNPVLSKRISISASSPVSRFTDPKVLASRTYQGTSFSGPRFEDGQICSWWIVDVGEDHQLMCNYYTLRQDGSRAFMRHWNLQGSSDGKNWTNLRVHENDHSVSKPGQFASWPVARPQALLPCRYFRVILTGPTTDLTSPWKFCICFLELYGYFR